MNWKQFSLSSIDWKQSRFESNSVNSITKSGNTRIWKIRIEIIANTNIPSIIAHGLIVDSDIFKDCNSKCERSKL